MLLKSFTGNTVLRSNSFGSINLINWFLNCRAKCQYTGVILDLREGRVCSVSQIYSNVELVERGVRDRKRKKRGDTVVLGDL